MTTHAAPLPFPPYLDNTEARIIGRLIDAALRQGLAARIHDGEEWTGPISRDRIAIARDVGHTDYTALVLYRPVETTWLKAGQIDLVHGNGDDVVSDHTDNEATGNVVKEAGL